MNNSETLGLLATLREITELLAGLDLANLPEIGSVKVATDFRHDGMHGTAQLYADCATELDAIEAIGTWAGALGGVVLLGDEKHHTSTPYRQLSALLRLPSGAMFEVWDHLHELRPSPEWAPPAPGMVALPLEYVA